MEITVNIAMIADEGYLLTTAVAIRSLVRYTSPKNKYHISIVTSENGEKVWQDIYKETIPQKDNIQIDCIIYEVPFENFTFKHGYVSKNALIKFYLPEIFDKEEKLLYIDGDVLFLDDIADLYSHDIEDYYAAAIKDMLAYEGNHREKIGVQDYFNSGVLLLNLKKIRSNNMVNRLVEYRINQVDTSYMDQDAFNVCFKDKVKYISPTYNMIQECFRVYTEKQIADFYGEGLEDLKHIKLIHLAGPVKPWKSTKSEQYANWTQYLWDVKELSQCIKNYFQSSEQEMLLKIDQIKQDTDKQFAEVLSKIKYLEDENVQRLLEKNSLEQRYELLQQKYDAMVIEDQMLKEAVNGLQTQLIALQGNFQNVQEDILCHHSRLEILENTIWKKIVRKIKKILKGN